MTFDELEEFSKIYHHKFIVLKYLSEIIRDLVTRAETHDDSKFTEEEFQKYVQIKKDFKEVEFGSPEYDALRAKHAGSFDIHYKNNRHHPEHFQNGIEDMTLVDLIELLVDWKAASMRNKEGGNIDKSIQISAERYKINPQLIKILENTARECKM